MGLYQRRERPQHNYCRTRDNHAGSSFACHPGSTGARCVNLDAHRCKLGPWLFGASQVKKRHAFELEFRVGGC